MKRYFDAIVIVPLEEEFEVVLEKFNLKEDLSTENHIRLAVEITGFATRILLVKQSTMGKTACQEAAYECLDEFECGTLFCVGIAGALSRDVSIGDICYTGLVCDVLDNAKIVDLPSGQQNITLSPTWYRSPTALTIPIALDRILPSTKAGYAEWLDELEVMGKRLIPGEFTGRDGKEVIRRPKGLEGIIVCGLVSGSPSYNDKLRQLDRKVLAIETESGGLFSISKQFGVAAISIRGISDYAGVDKNIFERETNNKGRKYAISTASSFLMRMLASDLLVKYFDQLNTQRLGNPAQLSLEQIVDQRSTSADILVRQDDEFNSKLRNLAPAYSLVQKGFRLPVPRIRVLDARSGVPDVTRSRPVEVRDALSETRIIILHVPREYPDLSLSWVIARDLLSAQVGDSQIVPSVVEAAALQRPRFGLTQIVDPAVLGLADEPEFTNVFIINDFDFGSKTRTDFLKEQIDEWSNSKFIIV